MKRRMSLALITTLTIGTMLLLTNANAFDRGRSEGFNTAGFEPFVRTTSPTWTPSWSATWTPAPQLRDTVPSSVPSSVPDSVPSYAPSSGALSAGEVADLLRGAGFPEYVIPEMVSIAYRESHFQPGAINPVSSACGLLQVYPFREGCLDPKRNVAMGYAKFRAAQEAGGTGLEPWALTA